MVDRYTKIVLTVIAASLATIAIKGVIPSAQAQNYGPMHVIVDQWGAYLATYPIPVHEQ